RDQHLAVSTPPALAGPRPADIRLVHLDGATQPLAPLANHRRPQFVEHLERRLVVEIKLAGKLARREARRVRRDEIRGPEPQPQRHPRSVHDGSRRHRRLIAARLALEESACRLSTTRRYLPQRAPTTPAR